MRTLVMCACTLALTIGCASGQVITRQTECGIYTGSVGGYYEFVQACGVDVFARTVAERQRVVEKAAKKIWEASTADQRRQEELARGPERVAEALQDTLDRKPSARWRIAVPSPHCAAARDLCDAVSARIEEILIRGNATVLNRAHVNNAIAQELRFSYSGNVDEKTAAKLGRFLGATHVLVISVGPNAIIGIPITITARIIDVERTTAVASVSREFEP